MWEWGNQGECCLWCSHVQLHLWDCVLKVGLRAAQLKQTHSWGIFFLKKGCLNIYITELYHKYQDVVTWVVGSLMKDKTDHYNVYVPLMFVWGIHRCVGTTCPGSWLIKSAAKGECSFFSISLWGWSTETPRGQQVGQEEKDTVVNIRPKHRFLWTHDIVLPLPPTSIQHSENCFQQWKSPDRVVGCCVIRPFIQLSPRTQHAKSFPSSSPSLRSLQQVAEWYVHFVRGADACRGMHRDLV